MPTTTTQPPIVYSASVTVEAPAESVHFQGKSFYRLRFEITETENLPLELFYVQRRAINPLTGERNSDRFIGVCGPVDLTSIPSDTPNDQQFIRTSVADLLIDSPLQKDATIKEIQLGLDELVKGMYHLSYTDPIDSFTARYPTS